MNNCTMVLGRGYNWPFFRAFPDNQDIPKPPRERRMSTSPNQKKSALSRRGFFKATAATAAVSSVSGRMGVRLPPLRRSSSRQRSRCSTPT